MKNLLIFLSIFGSFWLGAFLAITGYVNGDDDLRNQTNNIFRCHGPY